jgi:hypothetical protein
VTSFAIDCGGATTSIDLPSLASADSISVQPCGAFQTCEQVDGGAVGNLGTLSLPALTTLSGMSGSLTLAGNPTLDSVSLPVLQTAQSIIVTGNSTLQTLSLPALTALGGAVTVDSNGALGPLAFPLLQTAGPVSITNNATLPTVSFAALTASAGVVSVTNNPMLLGMSLPALKSAAQLLVTTNASLSSLAVPKIASVSPGACPYNEFCMPQPSCEQNCCSPGIPGLEIYENSALPAAEATGILAQLGYSECPSTCYPLDSTLATCGFVCGNLGGDACPF